MISRWKHFKASCRGMLRDVHFVQYSAGANLSDQMGHIEETNVLTVLTGGSLKRSLKANASQAVRTKVSVSEKPEANQPQSVKTYRFLESLKKDDTTEI